MGKRAFDLVFAALGLILTSPLLFIAAITVRFSGPGPLLFRQERIGRDFRPFTIYKFRTMFDGAPTDPSLTVRGDKRVTPAGAWLRRLKLDELPQLFNVLKGEMSIVGPRPEVRRYVDLFRKDYADILRVRPGITDEASIAFRHEDMILTTAADPHVMYVKEVLPRKIDMAKEYVRHRSMRRDIVIILRTLLKL